MSALSKITLALLSVTIVAATADAQAPQWNRRISDVRIVHPPATPPGTYRVEAEVEIGMSDTMPAGSDGSMDVTLLLNDVPIDVETFPETTDQVIQCYGGGHCTDAAACTTYNQRPGYCSSYFVTYPLFPSGTATEQVCYCIDRRIRVTTWIFNPTDRVAVHVGPSVGSLPETATLDDSVEIVVGENDPSTPTCSGDGSLPVACPCGNNGAPGHGCSNSANPSGALLTATGFTEIDPMTGTDAVVLHGSGMPATSSCIYLKSDGFDAAGAPFGDGVSCLTGSLIRLRTKFNVGGTSKFPEPGDPSLSVRGGTPSGSGVSGWYQVFYRNAASYCTPATYNISGGLRIDW